MRYFRSVVHLALCDIWHERVLTLCLLLSMSAIIGPLLLLFGLKNGVIDTLRARLLRDPTSREIYPNEAQAKPFPDDWFSRMRQRPDVEFVVPRLDVAGDMTLRFTGGEDRGDPIPAACEVAAEGDPRLPEMGFVAPRSGEVVLTRSLADKLRVRPGETVNVMVDRTGLSGSLETVSAELQVSGLHEDAVPSERVWLPLEFLVGVRDYREGLAVPELAWPGRDEEATPIFDALLTLATSEIGDLELKEVGMIHPPGLSDTEPFDSEALFNRTGLAPTDPARAASAILWRAIRNTIPARSAEDLRKRLSEKGIDSLVLPWIDPLPVEILTPDGTDHSLCLFVLEESEFSKNDTSPAVAEIRRLVTSNWREGLFKTEPKTVNSFTPNTRRVITISVTSPLPEGEADLRIEGMAGPLLLPVRLVKGEDLPISFGLISAETGGRLRRSMLEPVVYVKERGIFKRQRDRFRDFRLFASTLEDVAPLAREFEDLGIPVRHSAERISQILQLDSNLTRLFWIVASASAGAGFFGLIASFFASIERKRRALGVLQLIGMPKIHLFALPMLQSAILSLASFGLALFIYRVFSDLINTQFISELRAGESFCSLPRGHALDVLKATLGFSLGASFLAAVRSSRIQPSHALRSE